MENKHRIKINILILGMIFAISTINSFMIFNFQGGSIKKIENRDPTGLNTPKISGYWTTNFIHVDGNWSYTVGNYSWAIGNGSWSNPYTIENVTIDASTSPTGSGIYINNSKNEYFVIRNCTIYGAGILSTDAGIKFENTNNGTIINSNCSQNGENGIILINNCINNTISGNTANDNGYSGIYIDNNCVNNTLLENTAGNKFTLNQYNGIFLDNSVNNTLSLNIASNNSQFGILFNEDCNDNTLSENILNDNGFAGILLDTTCMNNTILENTIYNNSQNGIDINDGCDDNKILKNYLYFNTNDAIIIGGADNDDNFFKQNIMVSVDHRFINGLGTNTLFVSNYYLTSIPRLFIETITQSFSTPEFYVIINISSQCIGLDILISSLNAWWNGIEVSPADITDLGNSLYNISLIPIYVNSGGAPILLNMRISVPHHKVKYFETYIAVEPPEIAVKLLQVEITEHSYSLDHFNFTIFVGNETGKAIDSALIQMWWNGTEVSNDIVNLGSGFYFVSLEPITVAPGEDPILLNTTISAEQYQNKTLETYIAVTLDALDNGDGGDGGIKGIGGMPPLIISVATGIGLIGITLYLLHKRKSTINYYH
ncbi:MAG: right-handed parallel beta-helix repeat-containing protein [Candidatus Lokiarchaeia archaeon]